MPPSSPPQHRQVVCKHVNVNCFPEKLFQTVKIHKRETKNAQKIFHNRGQKSHSTTFRDQNCPFLFSTFNLMCFVMLLATRSFPKTENYAFVLFRNLTWQFLIFRRHVHTANRRSNSISNLRLD